ncbi:MAG: transposase, partial [Acidobacteriota bacterium]
MGRLPRFIPDNEDGVLVEVTSRVIGARAMLVPSPAPHRFNEVVVGVLGRALEISPLELCSTVWLANHLHCLVVVRDQQQLSRFMHHLGCNVSKEIGGRLRDWRGAFWERRYTSIVVSDEPEAQWRRLKYHLSHGVKEGLVESPLQWPGVHAAAPL